MTGPGLPDPSGSDPSPGLSEAAGSPVSVERGTREARLDVLDGFRALAIVMVAAFHYTVRWVPPLDDTPGLPQGHLPAAQATIGFAPFFYGWMGVELFFLISGFVILLTLERCAGLADFAARRFARLWPPMLVAATVTALVVNLAGPADWRVASPSWLGSVLFVPPEHLERVFHRHGLDWADGVYWTLWVEVRFYVLAGALYLLPRRAFLPAMFAVELLAAALFRLPSHRLHELLTTLIFPQYLPFFVFGMGGYLLFSGRGGRFVLATMAVSAALVLARPLLEGAPVGTTPLGVAAGLVVIFALFLGFVLRARFVEVFAWRPMVAVGRASYSFYLLHQKLGVMMLAALTGAGVPLALGAPVVFAAFALLALGLFAAVEEPVKRWIHRRTRAAVGFVTARASWMRYRRAPAPASIPRRREVRA